MQTFPISLARTRRLALCVALGLGLLGLGAFLPVAGVAAQAIPARGASEQAGGPYDLIIEGGRVVDGTGNPWFYGDVAVDGDRIVRVAPAGALAGVEALERVDARGLVVAPGFIDIQSHSRYALLSGDGRLISKVTQGVTTEIMGEGTTDAPLNGRAGGEFSGRGGFSRWLEAMEAHGASTNLGSFVGATTIRLYGVGSRMGAAQGAVLDSMKTAVRWAMEEGAFGIASALIYPPGNYASTEELIEISKPMAPLGGVYITHMRSEADQVVEAVDEALRIGREAGVPVEIYHLKVGGVRNHAKMPQIIAQIDAARADGQDVQATIYPYAAGGTGLSACMPPSASEGGRLFSRLADPAERAKIRDEILAPGMKDWENLCELSTPEGVMVLGFDKPENAHWSGMRLSEVAAEMGTDWVEAAMDLLVSERQRIGTIFFMMSEDNVRLGLQQPWIKIGTDAGGLNPNAGLGLVHPRAYGTYPRILGRYVREEGALSLEDAVRKMSSAVASRLSIGDRGVLAEGMFADLVIFDAETVIDHATFEEPHQLSEGVLHVWVNGQQVLRDGRHTGAKPGRVVRGPGYRADRPWEPR